MVTCRKMLSRIFMTLFGLLAFAVPAFAQQNSVWVVPVDTEITPATAQFIVSRIEQANEERPLALLFEIDTPGGQVRAMERIVDAILTRSEVPTLAVVRNAYSAGALVAMSAERLAMLPGSAIGAAMPVAVSPVGVSPVDAKTTSALRGAFRSVAEARGRNPLLAEAMVDMNIDVPGLAVSGELLTLTAQQAVENDIADIQANNLQDALAQFGYGGAPLTFIEPTLTERAAGWLSTPIVAALLLVVGIGGLLIELFTPGFGVPGALGILALALLGITAVLGTPASSFDLVLLVVGVILIMLEIFVLQGTFVAGLLGAAAILTSLVRIFQDDAVAVLGWSALFGSAVLILLLWLFPRGKLGSAFMLRTTLAAGGGTVSMEPGVDLASLVGLEGVTTSDLRPAGVARINGERIDVISQGDFIPTGSLVQVRSVEGNRVVVRLLEPGTNNNPTGPEEDI